MATKREDQIRFVPQSVENFLRDFEWTWAKAAVFCLAFGFVLLITQAVIPSAMFYFAFSDEGLGWQPGAPAPLGLANILPSFITTQMVVEAIVMGWVTTTVVLFLASGVVLQNWRRRLRGHDHIRAGYGGAA